ncbi:LOW QUALITY PROTEIN: Protein of unknown function, partial [Gryllus bimaculatus]
MATSATQCLLRWFIGKKDRKSTCVRTQCHRRRLEGKAHFSKRPARPTRRAACASSIKTTDLLLGSRKQVQIPSIGKDTLSIGFVFRIPEHFIRCANKVMTLYNYEYYIAIISKYHN